MAAVEEGQNDNNKNEDEDGIISKTEYYQKMDEYYSTKSERRLWTREQTTKIIDELKTAKEIDTTKTSRQYWLLKKYDVLEVGEIASLIIKRNSVDDALVQIVPYEDIFDKLKEIHVAKTRHLGRDKIASILTNKCYYIPRPPIHLFIECCNVCNKNKTLKRNVLVIQSSAGSLPAVAPPPLDNLPCYVMGGVAADADDPAREEFHAKLDEYYVLKKNRRPYTRAEVQKMISELKQVKELQSKRKSSHQYWLMKKYALLEAEGTTHVIIKPKNESDPLVHVVPYEDLYDRLREVHLKTGHGGRDRMVGALAEKCYHIARPAIVFFIESCKSCNRTDGAGGKRDRRPGNQPQKPPVLVTAADFNLKGQVDFGDFRASPDGEYKWLLVYQDLATKHVALRPMKSDEASEVAAELLKVFSDRGPPQALQSSRGREFVGDLVEELEALWPECSVANAHARLPKGRGAVKKASQDVEKMLRTWMQENDSRTWAYGCYFVQWRRNTSKHRLIGKSPYSVVYGHEPKGGLPPASPDPPESKCPEKGQNLGEAELASNVDPNTAGPEYQLAPGTSMNGGPPNRTAYPSGQELFSSIGLEQIVCCVCGHQAVGSHRCDRCTKYVHAMCGQTLEEAYGKSVLLCYHCQHQEDMNPQYHGQKRPAVPNNAPMMMQPPAKKGYLGGGDCSGYILYH